jgi:hypothetical protein
MERHKRKQHKSKQPTANSHIVGLLYRLLYATYAYCIEYRMLQVSLTNQNLASVANQLKEKKKDKQLSSHVRTLMSMSVLARSVPANGNPRMSIYDVFGPIGSHA